MKVVEALHTLLAARPVVDGAAIVDWRLEIVASEGVRVGLRNSQLGGAYEGPGSAARLGGAMELHWSDGLLSNVSLDRTALLEPAAHVVDWRTAAFSMRRDGLPPIAGPTVLPAVETFDPAVGLAVDGEPSRFLTLLGEIQSSVFGAGMQRIDGVLRASRGSRIVLSSRGFRAAWQETACSLDLWADELAHASYGRRALPSDEDVHRLAAELVSLAPALRTEQALPASAHGVIFSPGVLDALLGRLLLPNLAGRAIRDGRSPLTRADLEAGREIVRPDLSLVIDTTLPLELATAPCSSDGVAAGRVALIADGRLVSPTIDLATAADFGLPPTPAPRGRPSALLVQDTAPVDLETAAAKLGDGVIVRDLPGLHTQQPRRSRYALVAPDAQVVHNGVPGGRCAVRLAGNLLDHLSQPSMRLVRMSGELGTGLLVDTGVELIRA